VSFLLCLCSTKLTIDTAQQLIISLAQIWPKAVAKSDHRQKSDILVLVFHLKINQTSLSSKNCCKFYKCWCLNSCCILYVCQLDFLFLILLLHCAAWSCLFLCLCLVVYLTLIANVHRDFGNDEFCSGISQSFQVTNTVRLEVSRLFVSLRLLSKLWTLNSHSTVV